MGKTFHIVKRDGALVPFDEQKIINAIEKANVTMEHEREKISPTEVQDILSLIQYRLETDEKNGKNLTVEEIQDIIVHSLLKMGHEKLGLSYECYRVTKSALRDMQTSTSFEQTYESIMKLVNGSNKDVQEENSNKDASINSTQRDLIAGEVSKYFTDKYLLPRKIVKAHEDGVLHFHDKDYFIQPMTNCCLINISDMLDNGTVMNGLEIHSPHTFKTAATVMTQVVASVASNQYGFEK